MSCYLIENVQENREEYVNKTVYDVPKVLLNEFLMKNGCQDYSRITPLILDLMRKAVEERKNKS